MGRTTEVDVTVRWHGDIVRVERRKIRTGARTLPPELGTFADLAAVSVEVTPAPPLRRPRPSRDGQLSLSHVVSAAFHGILLAMVSYGLAGGDPDAEDRVAIVRDAVALRSGSSDAPGDSGERDSPASGSAPVDGRAPESTGHAQTRERGDRRSPTSRDVESERAEAAAFGMISLLGSLPSTEGSATWAGLGDPTGAFGAGGGLDGALTGGLGLSSAGEGGGGRGEGIGVGRIGTVGGSGWGCGCGNSRLGGSHQTKAPSIRCGSDPEKKGGGCTASVHGRLPPEAIQRVVRQNFGRFRLCYEKGLATNPSLAGRVSIKFVIDDDGSVSTAVDGGSDMADAAVVSCIVRAMATLSFPEPEGGIVTVVYPLVLSPE